MGPKNRFLIGGVAAGLVVVDSTDRRMSPREQRRIHAEVTRGLAYLVKEEPRARLKFQLDVNAVSLESPTIQHSRDEAELPHWLSPTFSSLGFTGSAAYLDQLCARHDVDQGFVIVVATLPMPHYAFTSENVVILSRFCGGFGIGSMHALLIHEICHVFGAADEAGNCHCGELHGYLGIPHDNCHLCNAHAQPCIMAADAVALCPSTRRKIGWYKRLFPT